MNMNQSQYPNNNGFYNTQNNFGAFPGMNIQSSATNFNGTNMNNNYNINQRDNNMNSNFNIMNSNPNQMNFNQAQFIQSMKDNIKKENELFQTNIKTLREELKRRKTKREEKRKNREIVLFFNDKNSIIPLTFKTDDFLFQVYDEYKNISNKQNYKLVYKGITLQYSNNTNLNNIEGLVSGDEIIVE